MMKFTRQTKIAAVIIIGIVAVIASGNAAVVWFLTRGSYAAMANYAPLILLLCVTTPLLSASAAFIVVVILRRRQERQYYIPFDLHDLLTECRALIMPKAAEKGIILHFYGEPAISKIPLGDPERLRKALVILLTNAIKYTNTGMVKLHSVIKEMREKDATITFEVKDSGAGMTDEQIRKMLNSPTYEVRDIVKMMGGKLRVDSVPGVGSKFSFDLTFDTNDESSAKTSDNADEKENIPDKFEKPAFEGEVLLCEDSVMNQQIICEHLERVGLKTVVAENGKIGVEMVQDRINKGEKQFDLILMDIHMPVMDGLEAAAKITTFKTGIPIIAITANIMPNDLEVYKMSGIYDSVGKPFTSQELWRCLGQYFKPRRRQLSAETHFLQVKNKMRQKMAAHFIKDNRNLSADIKNAINAGDIKLAHRLAHTLKGSAGQLGKFLLQQAALEVEQHLKDENNRVTPKQLAALEAELNTALAELAPLAEEGYKDA